MKRRLIAAVSIAGVLAIVGVLTFGGGAPPPIEWSSEPASWRWEGQWGWRAYEWVADRNAKMSKAIRRERSWCVENHTAPPDELTLETIFAADNAALLAHLEEPFDPAADVWMEQIVAELERLRGVTLDAMPDVRVFSPDTWRRLSCWTLLQSENDAPQSPAWTLGQLVGYLEPQWTPAMQTHLNRSYTAGLYDSSEQDGLITLISDVPLPEWTVETFAHEVVHALQDQLLGGGLDALYGDRTTDQFWAIDAVVEGDAEATMWALYEDSPLIQRIISAHSWGRDQPFDGSTVLISDLGLGGASVIAPYDRGREFVRAVRRELGDDAVKELLRDPPDSYEQILHRPKFRADERPAPIEPLLQLRDQVLKLPDPAQLTVDTLGEAAIADLIGFSTVDTTRTRVAAHGWATDAITLVQRFEDEPTTVVIWQIAFDDADEHAEGVQGIREWLIAASGAEARPGRDGRAIAWDGESGAIRVVNHAGLVWVLAATERRIADELTARIFDLDERWAPSS